MRQPDLRTFLQQLRDRGELLTITREVETELEIAAIADRASRAGPNRAGLSRAGPNRAGRNGARPTGTGPNRAGPNGTSDAAGPGGETAPDGNKALLFTNVVGSRFPVLINALGSEARMNLVCGVQRREQLQGLIGDFVEQLERPRTTLREKLGALPLLSRLGKLFPRYRGSGACQDVVHEGEDVDLFELPILRTWPDDAGPVVTLPLVFTKDPHSGARNCGMYRLQRYDKNTFGFHVHTHHTGADHLRKYKALGRDRMPVAVVVGASAATVFSAVAPLPPGVDELLFAAFLQGTPVDLVHCRTVPLEVPACAEFVIEGWVPVDELRREGPFGDHTGFYSLADDYHVLHVTALTHRKDAIWHTTVVGPPPQEDCWMGAAIERLFLPLQRKVMPEVLDMRLPFAGVFHNLMLLRIKKDYPGQAHKVAHTVWGMGQAMFTKVVVVFDEDAPDLRDDEALVRLLLERLDVSRDIAFVLGPTETLDHASRALHFGSKVLVDLTREFPGEGARRTSDARPGTPRAVGATSAVGVAGAQGAASAALAPPALPALPAPPEPVADEASVVAVLRQIPGVADATVLFGGAVAVTVDKVRPSVPRVTLEVVWAVGERHGFSAVTDRVLMLSKGERLDDPVRLLWLLLAHIDPERDVERASNPRPDATLRTDPGFHPRRIGVDATAKSPIDGFSRPWPTEQVHPERVLNKIANHWRDLGFPGECP